MMGADHEIKWMFDQDCVTGEAVCNAPADAVCRNMPACQCEEYYGLERDDKGWFHLYEEYVTGGEAVEVKHRHIKPTDYCNIAEWLNNSDLEACAAGRPKFEIARTPIDLEWSGDYYEWKLAEKRLP